MQLGEPGQVLGGKYRLTSQLSGGGMGAVWLAEHLTLHSPVALKLIDPIIATEPLAVQRFLREARTAALLRSPHVVQILDYGVDGDTPYIAMEMLDGESLATRLDRVGRVSVTETARVIRHVARAIGRAHDAGVVHRDLKPENIFIVQNDDDEVIKVLDFGIVKTNASGLDLSVSPTSTRTGTLLGTPYFMSPEQAEGVKSVDYRADIWALGVIAYRCLLGDQPFRGDSIGRLILEICSHPLPVPSNLGPVPVGFDAWFARACARDPAARFESAKQAADEFERLDGGAWSAPSSRDDAFAASSASRSEALPSTTTSQLSSAMVQLRPARLRWPSRWVTASVVGASVVALAALLYGGRESNAGGAASSASMEHLADPVMPREPASIPAPVVPPPSPELPASRPSTEIAAAAPPTPAPPAPAPPPADSVDGATEHAAPSPNTSPAAAEAAGVDRPSAETVGPPSKPRVTKRRPPSNSRLEARRRRKAAVKNAQPEPAPEPTTPPSVDLGI